MKAFRSLALFGALVAFALAMLGSWTRINQAGMTCPDWPLCQGAVVPVLHGGVVLEWMHRLLAALETFVVVGLIVIGWRLRDRLPILKPMLLALGAVFVLQILIGGATIKYANSPLTVMIHWGTAMLLLALLSSLAVLGFAAPAAGARASVSSGNLWLWAVAGWAWLTMCVGAFVSSSGAGLACPSVPGCGDSFFGVTGPQALQMTHRFLAAALVVFAAAAAAQLGRMPRRSAVAFLTGAALLALQITLGVLNVVWLLPTALREAHAANAVATFLAFVVATVFATLDAGTAVASVRDKETSYAL